MAQNTYITFWELVKFIALYVAFYFQLNEIKTRNVLACNFFQFILTLWSEDLE